MCPFMSGQDEGAIWYFGIKVFMIIWIIFVPIAMTARLERIIKLLEDKKKN